MPFAGDAPNVLKYIAADERSGNGDPGEADLELWIVTDYVEKGTSLFFLDSGHRQGSTDQKNGWITQIFEKVVRGGPANIFEKWTEGSGENFENTDR